MKFICLDNKTVVDAKKSDHDPIVFGNVCTFNLLCKCCYNTKWQYFNNGFKCQENIDDYKERLDGLIPIIVELHEKNNIQIFLFQEAPPMVNVIIMRLKLQKICLESEMVFFSN